MFITIGRLSEAGLLEWMRFVIFRARGRSALPGRFLSRRCFTLCITAEAEPRIAKQYKCQYCCSCKNYCGKWMEGGKKGVSASYFCWPEDREFVEKKCVLGHPIARATSYCLLPDTFWVWASRNAFKVGSEKVENSVTVFHCEESTHRKQMQPRDARQKSRELTTPPELPNSLQRFSVVHTVISQ